jgi:3-keto-disaccharide hydrolase
MEGSDIPRTMLGPADRGKSGLLEKFHRLVSRLMIRPLVLSVVLAMGAASGFAGDANNALTPEEQAAGWKLLFDGKTAPGLRGLQKRDFLEAGWTVQDGTLVLPKTVRQSGNVTGGDLVTAEQFADFEFKFDFKLTASALSGVLYFARGGLGQKPTGHEYQIIDDVHHPEGLKGGPLHRTGALTGVLPPGENKKFHEADEWNSGAIVVQGKHVEHWLNGAKVLEYELGSRELLSAVKASKEKLPTAFGSKIKSSLAILDKGEEVAFRNLKIRVLPATPPPAPPPLAAPEASTFSAAKLAPSTSLTPAPPPATPVPVAPKPVVAATPAPVATKPEWKLPPPPPPPVLRP